MKLTESPVKNTEVEVEPVKTKKKKSKKSLDSVSWLYTV